ncbi:MAG TPA: GNAT family N-acetyltransferase [Longimicrobiaceae bacterium]|nr:GNAT family N-acetyltransferase [Longimicrobiaceae bacterium]
MGSEMLVPFDTPEVIEVGAITWLDNVGAPFEVRASRPADLGALMRFYHDFEPKRAAQGLPPAEPDRIARWLAGVLATGIHKLAFRQRQLIGHAFVTPTTRAGIGEYAVFLHQAERGLGIGTLLNRATVDAARNRGLRGLWLTVEPQNRAAIRSYEKVGFRFVPSTAFSIEPEMELEL